MKAITLWEPWASLMAYGIKRLETRSWQTTYRGSIAIHAARKPISQVRELVGAEAFARLVNLLPEQVLSEDIHYGEVLAVGTLNACTLITPEFAAALPERERTLGDFTPGRYAWRIDDMQLLPVPVPAAGAQGVWDFNYADPRNFARTRPRADRFI